MSDMEKTPVQAGPAEPTDEAGTTVPRQNKLMEFLTLQTNDPNILGKELLQKALEIDEEQLERDGVKVRRKLDWIVIPMV
jgi:hypothetical protein